MAASRIAVVGGGILGVAVAREIVRRDPAAHVTVFEKEARLAAHQTGHNSGVVHAGLYYTPGSLKARLCRRGVNLLTGFVADKGVAYEECGKLVVAQSPEESRRLDGIEERARANGVPGLRVLEGEAMREVEPEVTGLRALHSPHTAIVDYVAMTEALAEDLRAAGGTVRLRTGVARLETRGSEVRAQVLERDGSDEVVCRDAGEAFDLAVTCAGLQADRLAAASGLSSEPAVVPFFGDYMLLAPTARPLVRGLIYPVPDPAFPFLGVHLTKRVDGEVMVGPNAFLAFSREDYRPLGVTPRDVLATAGYPGFWRFSAANWRAATREVRTALSRRWFVEEARRFVPAIGAGDVLPGPRGIRAQALGRDGTMVDDFVIERRGRVVQVRNAPSPAATSSMAIAEYVVDEALAAR
ncbi:L-2-hydroxyglutarate oxidase [Actinomycetota bacterium]